MAQIFNQAFEQKLIYVYRINDTAHEGILKIGEASSTLFPVVIALSYCESLIYKAPKRSLSSKYYQSHAHHGPVSLHLCPYCVYL